MKDRYTAMCPKCYRKTWYSAGEPCHNTVRQHYHRNGHCAYREVKCRGVQVAIDYSGLSERLTPYYESRERIEITYANGERIRCRVGMTTGWKPAYIAILRRDSVGGFIIATENIERIQIV